MLIGRKKEQEQLLSAMREEDSMFVAVYGRRRVGKTYLVRETFANNFTFYHTGLAKSPMKKQLAAWKLSLREYGMKKPAMPKTWLEAFDMLKDIIRQSEEPKKIIFIDEMPWMDTQRSGFIPALENFWNGWASARKDIILIICGSATSWIINKVIKFNELYASLFKNPAPYIKVVNTLGTKRIGMTREELITEGRLSDNGKLSEILEDLEACGFIRRYKAFGQRLKGAMFQLIDSYTLFYYRFIKQNRQDDEHFWSSQTGTPIYYNWCGLAFERICLLHVSQIKKALGIYGTISTVCSWRSCNSAAGQKGAQIDLLIDRSDNVIDICEMKYTKEPYEMDATEDAKIQNRRSRFIEESGTDKAIHLVLVSAAGVKRNSYSDEFQSVITAESLFDA